MPRQKYLVLRNCFTEECRYFKKGEVVELPESMYKYEKNFRLVDRSMTEPPPEPKNELVCQVCGKECKSKFGLQSHIRVHNK